MMLRTIVAAFVFLTYYIDPEYIPIMDFGIILFLIIQIGLFQNYKVFNLKVV